MTQTITHPQKTTNQSCLKFTPTSLAAHRRVSQ